MTLLTTLETAPVGIIHARIAASTAGIAVAESKTWITTVWILATALAIARR